MRSTIHVDDLRGIHYFKHKFPDLLGHAAVITFRSEPIPYDREIDILPVSAIM